MLSVEDLHFEYKTNRIITGLSLEAQANELIGVVGPNGSGKTTLLKLMSGVLKPSHGHIKVNDVDLATLKAQQRAKLVSVVPQNPQLPLNFKVIDLVLMGRNPHLGLLQWESQRDLQIARRAMELTDTLHLANKAIGTLSGGERQRALIAIALAQEAIVLLLDEPTSNLDLAHQSSIMDLVRNVQQALGGTTVIAMHDLTLAARYCHRLVMLSQGTVYLEGTPEIVLTKENILNVYGTNASILMHPESDTPVVLPSSLTNL